jgi:hypothetical protein
LTLEFAAFDPHPVQNESKLSSDGNLGFAQPAALRKPDLILDCQYKAMMG